MTREIFSHQRLDVYRVSLEFVAFSFDLTKNMARPYSHTKDQLIRACQSIPLNIAEGNGKSSELDKRRFWSIARGSAFECSAILDVLKITNGINEQDYREGMALLHRTVSMLTRMTEKTWSVKEDEVDYGDVGDDGGHDDH